jgi:hypothetical protein
MANKPRNRNGYSAQRAEAQDKPAAPTRVKFAGHTYNVPHPNNWDLDVLDFMYSAEKEEDPMAAIGIMRTLLGKAQWEAFKDRNKGKGAEPIGDFMQAMTEALDKGDSPNS